MERPVWVRIRPKSGVPAGVLVRHKSEHPGELRVEYQARVRVRHRIKVFS